MIRYMTVCSGIEAPTVAWRPLGWEAVAFSEIEPFPCAVLAHHYPDVPNLGDMRTINGADFRGKIDLLVGGTPCQSFSVAGLRRGLEDERGNLALEFVRIADEAAPDFVVWENVPGVLSDRGNAFGCFLAALAGEDAPLEAPGGKWSDAGYVLGPARTIAWRALDAQYFGLAQRRKRVFLVGCPRTGADPRKVLFEFDSMRRDFAPGRETGGGVAGTVKGGSGNPGWQLGGEEAAAGYLQLNHWEGGPHPCLNQSFLRSGGIGMSNQEIFSQQGAGLVPHQYIPEIVSQAISCKWSKGTSGPAGDEHHNLICAPVTTRPWADNESQETRFVVSQYGEKAATLTSEGADASPCADRGPTVIAFTERSRAQGRDLEYQEEQAYCLTDIGSGGNAHSRRILDGATRVRRLTPRECERLQGFPDDYTAIVYRGKPAADSPRYRALGNSMAVPVMRWIGKRIAHMEASL